MPLHEGIDPHRGPRIDFSYLNLLLPKYDQRCLDYPSLFTVGVLSCLVCYRPRATPECVGYEERFACIRGPRQRVIDEIRKDGVADLAKD